MTGPRNFVPSPDWRSEIVGRTALGQHLLALYGTAGKELRAVLGSPEGHVQVVSTEVDAAVESLVEVIPCAAWPEREAHDLYGIDFDGHEPMRPLVEHGSTWKVPVSGTGVHEVAVGPIHAGVIESGHFRFHNVGERILLLDLRLFYKYRGLERAAEGIDLAAGIGFAQRACATCAVANSIAYAHAAEGLAGLVPPETVRRARTVLLELERLYNHLNDLSAICAGVGFATGSMAFAALKERAQRLNRELFGHRFLFGSVAVGGSRVGVSGSDASQAAAKIEAIAEGAASAWRETLFNGSVQDRLQGIGVLTPRAARRLEAVGPAARASGRAVDARTHAPGLCYGDFQPVSPASVGGDVYARTAVRVLELNATTQLLTCLLKEGLEAADCSWSEKRTGPAVGMGRVESARGETVCCLEASGGRVRRLHLRTGSFRNWAALAEAVPGNLLPDFPLINKSFELCYACVDR